MSSQNRQLKYDLMNSNNLGDKKKAFTFQDDISFGLVQKRGGPCGVLAVVQAFILKYLLFTKSPSSDASSDKSSLYKSRDHTDHPTPRPSNQQREHALVQTLSHIILQVSLKSRPCEKSLADFWKL